jgi:hypothetical protein
MYKVTFCANSMSEEMISWYVLSIFSPWRRSLIEILYILIINIQGVLEVDAFLVTRGTTHYS